MFFNKRRLNKRGNVDDIATAIGILLTLVITFFLVYTVVSNFNTVVSTNNITNQSTQAMTFMDTYQTRYTSSWDYGVLFLAILLPIFSFMAARKIPVEPTNVLIAFLVLGFIILAAMIGANIYGAFLDNATFQTFTSQLKYIPIIMPNLVYYAMVYAMIVLIGLFSKERGEL